MVIRGPAIKLGSASATDPVALGPKVETELARIEAAMVAAIPVVGDGGLALQTSFLTALTVSGAFPAATGAAKVTAE